MAQCREGLLRYFQHVAKGLPKRQKPEASFQEHICYPSAKSGSSSFHGINDERRENKACTQCMYKAHMNM